MKPRVEPLPRRAFVRLAGAAALTSLAAACRKAPPAALTEPATRMVRFPDKAPMILLTDRAPQLETPLHYFRQDFTPNDAFFVRWHLEGVPTSVDTRTFRLRVGGYVDHPLSLSLDDLKTAFTPVSVVAVNQCSGNARSLYAPRVAGGQWKNGAMGNALWTGVPLKDLLARAAIKAGAVDVTFGGLDTPPLASIADFAKSLSVDHAISGDALVAYQMNGADLPMLNGFPLRLVVPGWYATYWVKALDEITVLDRPFDGFWMKKAYLIPDNALATETPEHLAKSVVPISTMSVRSIFVRPEPDEVVPVGQRCAVEGLALDQGKGIRRVEISVDGGASWQDAALDPELGRYSWRRWRFAWTPARPGAHGLLVRATNADGDTQHDGQWNHGGYRRCAIERLDVQAEMRS